MKKEKAGDWVQLEQVTFKALGADIRSFPEHEEVPIWRQPLQAHFLLV